MPYFPLSETQTNFNWSHDENNMFGNWICMFAAIFSEDVVNFVSHNYELWNNSTKTIVSYMLVTSYNLFLI